MKTILGTGQTGIAILQSLLAKNHDEKILLVNKSGKLNGTLPSNINIIAADVTSPADMETIAGKSEIMFSCTDRPYQEWPAFYPATASALAYALRKTNAKLVMADNMYSYGNVEGIELQEQMPHTAKTKKGRIRAGVIQSLLYSEDEYNRRVAFVKAADFIGPGISKGIFGTDFLNTIYEGRAVKLFGNIAAPHSFTNITDLAIAMINVGTAEDAFGQIWHAPNAPALSIDKWLHLFEVIAGKKIKKNVLPKFVLRAAGFFNPFVRELYEMAYQFEQPFIVNADKYINRFGNHAANPSEIVKETVAAYTSSQPNKKPILIS